MRVCLLVAIGLAAGAVGCGPAVEKCGEQVCTKEQRCEAKVCVADTPPVVTLEAPTEGAMVSTTTVEVKGSASDDDGAPVVELSSDDSTWVKVTLGANGSFSAQLPLPVLDFSAGKVSARARDSKGREVKVSRSLFVDNAPPACEITAPKEAVILTSTGTVTVTMTASDGSQVLTNPRISTNAAATFAVPTGTAGAYSYSWVQTAENGIVHEVVFRVDDASGHTCEVKKMITVDNVNPTVGFSSPTPGALLGPPFFASNDFRGPASDGTQGLKLVTLDLADGVGMRVATLAGGMWSVAVAPTATDDYKARTATVVATDLAGNSATAAVNVTVDVKAPVLAITTPSANAKLNRSTFADGGNNIPLAWTLTDGDPQLTIASVQTDGGVVMPPSLATSPTDNPKAYTATLRARDRAGNTTTVAVPFTVDRVSPTMTASVPLNNVRMFVGDSSADFSEPMMGGDGLGFNPYRAGSWPTNQKYVVGNLALNTVYTVVTGPALTDLHGNPVIPASFRFHTETLAPISGSVIANGYYAIVDAVADVEGVLSVLALSIPGNKIEWIQLHPATGAPTVLDTYPTLSVGKLVAARVVQADLSSRRLVGVWNNPGSGDQVRYSINGGAASTILGAQAFIPVPASPVEGTGLAEFGVITGNAYRRSGRTDLPLAITSVELLNVNDSRWEAIRAYTGGTESQTFGCYAPATGSPLCSLSPVRVLGGGGAGLPNAASSKTCSIHGYLSGTTEMTTLFKWQPDCGTVAPKPPCVAAINETNNFDQVVADPAADGTFYGYNVVNGTYEIKKRVLSSTSCAGAITTVGAPISLGTISGAPRLVVIRGAPGLIFADANNIIRFQTP